MVWAELGAAALGGAANYFGGQAQKSAEKERFKKVLALLQKAQGIGRTYGDAALQQQQAGLRDIQGGYGAALGETTNAGRSAEIDAISNAQNLFGGEIQNLVSSGMYSPQALLDAKRGLVGTLGRTVAAIREHTAGQRAGLLTGQGLASAGQRGNIAAQYGRNAQTQMGAIGEVADLYGQQVPYAQDYSGSIGALAGALGKIDWSKMFGSSSGSTGSLRPHGPYGAFR